MSRFQTTSKALHHRLGKWYYNGHGNQHFSNLATFRNLETAPASVHAATKKVFDHLENIDDSMEQIAAGSSEMESTSEGVFEDLDQILAEKKNKTDASNQRVGVS